MDVEGELVCVICGEAEATKNDLNQLGRYWNPQKDNEHPLEALITLAENCYLENLTSKLKKNKENNIKTYTRKNCRTKLRNQARPTKRKSADEPEPRSSKRLRGGAFDFKKLCF